MNPPVGTASGVLSRIKINIHLDFSEATEHEDKENFQDYQSDNILFYKNND